MIVRKLESYIYFRVIDLVRGYLYCEFCRVIIAIELYLETFKVIDFIFTRKNLHLLEGYIYYNLQLCFLRNYEVTFIIDLYLKTLKVMIY